MSAITRDNQLIVNYFTYLSTTVCLYIQVCVRFTHRSNMKSAVVDPRVASVVDIHFKLPVLYNKEK